MNILFSIFILPIIIVYKYIFLVFAAFTENYGVGLMFLSILNAFALLPISRYASKVQKNEEEIQKVLAPQIAQINKNLKGQDKNSAINRLYKRYAYHPLFAIRSAFDVFVQLPFLTAAYYMLSELPEIQGQAFLFIKDLSKPDGLLFGLNLLPFLMTAINIAVVYTSKISKKDSIQALVLAFLFLLLLYNAPSALLIFWTTNNIVYLVKSISKNYKTPAFNLSEKRFSKNPKDYIPFLGYTFLVFSIISLSYLLFLLEFNFLLKLLISSCIALLCVLLITNNFELKQRSMSFLSTFSCYFTLCVLTPFLYMWAVNAFMFETQVLLHTFLAFIVLFVFPFFFIGKLFDYLGQYKFKVVSRKISTLIILFSALATFYIVKEVLPLKEILKSNFWVEIVRIICISGVTAFTYLYFYNTKTIKHLFITLSVIIPSYFAMEYLLPLDYWVKNANALLVIKTFVLILLSTLVVKLTLKPLNVFLIVIALISIGQFSYNRYEENKLSSYITIDNPDEEILASTNLAKKPNIYFVYLESYQNSHTMKKVFNYPFDEFTDELKSYGFTVYDDFFANTQATAYNMYTLYTMQTYLGEEQYNEIGVPLFTNKVLIGGENNKVFNYLQSQDYYVFSDTRGLVYFEPKQDKYIDATFDRAVVHPESSGFLQYSLSVALYPVFEKLGKALADIAKGTRLEEYLVPNFEAPHKLGLIDLSKKVQLAMETTKDIKQPKILAFYSGVIHTSQKYHYTEKDEWVSSNVYQDRVKRMNEEIHKAVKYIEEHDPNSIIIFLGDHGVSITRGLEASGKTIPEFTKELNKAGFSLEDYVHDKFGVFCAIKMPKGVNQDISFGMAFSPANLFRHIFATLNNDDIFLKHKVPNTSRPFKALSPYVIEGKIMAE